MNHLVSTWDTLRIENNLLERKEQLTQASAWVFNFVMLGLVLSGFAYFLYVQYTNTKVEEDTVKRIPFEPTTWYSATRNVRSEEYGRQLQPFEVETRYGVP